MSEIRNQPTRGMSQSLRLQVRLLAIIAVVGVAIYLVDQVNNSPSKGQRSSPTKRVSAPAHPSYSRPTLDPSNNPWPIGSSYLSGSPINNSAGLSVVTVDNSATNFDVHLRLFDVQRLPPTAVRDVYIPAGQVFRMEDISAGSYELRYRNLMTGGLAKSEPFALQERTVAGGREYTEFSITLFTVAGGNTQMTPIDEAAFQ